MCVICCNLYTFTFNSVSSMTTLMSRQKVMDDLGITFALKFWYWQLTLLYFVSPLYNIYKDGQVFVAHTDMQKAEALCGFFSSVFVRESSEVFDTLPTRWKTEDTEPLSVEEAEVIDKIRN